MLKVVETPVHDMATSASDHGSTMRTFFRDNGLTIALMTMFLFSGMGMVWSGHAAFNEDLQEHAAAIGCGLPDKRHFLSALFENWESEFLQMAAYVMITAILFQRGSAEFRDPDDPERPKDKLPATTRRRSPVFSWLYSHSLGFALAILFVISLLLHLWGSLTAANEEALRHGGAVQSLGEYLFDSNLWFESFQNWQSEFMSTAVLVVLSIFLRHKGSPESKPTGGVKCRNRCLGGIASIFDQAIPEAGSNVVVEKTAFGEGVSKCLMHLRRNTLIIVPFAAGKEPHGQDLCARIVSEFADRG